MVVSCKMKDARVPKKNHNNPFSVLSHAHPHVSPKESLGSNSFEKDLGGLSITKMSEGQKESPCRAGFKPIN